MHNPPLRRFGAVLAVAMFCGASVSANARAGALDGLRVFGNDGTFLGAISCSSIGNRFSSYGNKFSSSSIWNKYSQYGSQFSTLSAFNQFTTTPPVIVNGSGQTVGHLTLNRYVGGAISPIALESYLMEQCNQSDSYRD